jgi:hypothetical protein
MAQQSTTRAAKWQRPERTVEDLNKICGDALRALKIPPHWKFIKYDRIPLEEGSTDIQSISAIFKDTNTTGFNLKHYRVNFHTYSERLSMVQVTFKEYGKPSYSCMNSNKIPEAMNEFFKTLN